MGSPDTEAERRGNEGPLHRVQLQSFFIGQTPVTQAQWQVVAGWPKQQLELHAQPSLFRGANRPVEQVSWYEAVEFCRRLSVRTGREYNLPSEAQWEYACRAGSTTPFAFGERLTADLANCDGRVPYARVAVSVFRCQPTEVGSFSANAWGLHDMHGNVWEWCMDPWHDSYGGASADGRAWIIGGGHLGCCAAGRGSASPGTAARPTATASTRTSATAASVSASVTSPRTNSLHLDSLYLCPLPFALWLLASEVF